MSLLFALILLVFWFLPVWWKALTAKGKGRYEDGLFAILLSPLALVAILIVIYALKVLLPPIGR
jgi:hypothetical protein